MCKTRLLFLVVFSISSLAVQGQYYQFQTYGAEAGLNDPFIYSIVQDTRGFLLVGTGEGLGVFDGVSYETKYTSDGLAEDFVSTLYRSSSGIVWVGHKEGGISYLNGDVIKKYQLKEEINSIITGISEDEEGVIWISTQNDGIFCVDIKSGVQKFYKDQFLTVLINDIEITDNKDILVATNNGLEVYNLDSDGSNLLFAKRYFETTNAKAIQSLGRNDYAVGTNQSGLFQINISNGEEFKIELPEDLLIKSLSSDDENNLYVSSHNLGMFKISV
ncbi:MAG: ligand-binding sensor domain-containing protein, partial [Parvicellaceae bacterium]